MLQGLSEQPQAEWGIIKATSITCRLVLRLHHTTATSNAITWQAHLEQLVSTLDELSDQYIEHYDLLLERFQALELQMEEIVADRRAIVAGYEKINRQIDAMKASSCLDSARTEQLTQSLVEVRQRSHEVDTREEMHRLNLAAIR